MEPGWSALSTMSSVEKIAHGREAPYHKAEPLAEVVYSPSLSHAGASVTHRVF